MDSDRACYFIRANGETYHNDPSRPSHYVPGEPPPSGRAIDYVGYCLAQNIARIGWPDVGDLRELPRKVGALCTAYDIGSIKQHEQKYLYDFRDIAVGSIVLMPIVRGDGHLYIGDVTRGYDYTFAPPEHPYECAHRIGVAWDRNSDGSPRIYHVEDVGLSTGGIWRRAFHRLDRTLTEEGLQRIDAARAARA